MEIMPEFDRSKGPTRQEERISPREIEMIKYRDNRTALTVKLVTGEEIVGAIRWYDDHALRLVHDDRSETTVFLHAISWYKSRA